MGHAYICAANTAWQDRLRRRLLAVPYGGSKYAECLGIFGGFCTYGLRIIEMACADCKWNGGCRITRKKRARSCTTGLLADSDWPQSTPFVALRGCLCRIYVLGSRGPACLPQDSHCKGIFLFASFMAHSHEPEIVQDLSGHTIATPAGSTSQSGAEAVVMHPLHRQHWCASGLWTRWLMWFDPYCIPTSFSSSSSS